MSLAGTLGSAAIAQGKQSISQAIGKRTLDLGSSGRASGASEINWVHFNYPPYLKIIHYDIDELPTSLCGLVRNLNCSMKVTLCNCVFNLLDNIVIVFSTGAPRRWLIQSMLHIVMLPALAFAVFYVGYRGLAEPDASLVFKYKVGQGLLTFFYFAIAMVPLGCANGFLKLATMSQYSEGSVFWTVFIVGESLVWLGNMLLSMANLYRVWTFDQFGTGAAATHGARF